jgi:hypothetical protein
MKCKLKVEDVSTGMYISELDRPWLESPFLFQGFAVESRRELSQLRESCEYVIVDLARSRPDLHSRIRRAAIRGDADSAIVAIAATNLSRGSARCSGLSRGR